MPSLKTDCHLLPEVIQFFRSGIQLTSLSALFALWPLFCSVFKRKWRIRVPPLSTPFFLLNALILKNHIQLYLLFQKVTLYLSDWGPVIKDTSTSLTSQITYSYFTEAASTLETVEKHTILMFLGKQI